MVRLVVGCEGREVALKLYEKIGAELLSGFRSQSRCELAPAMLVGAGARIDEHQARTPGDKNFNQKHAYKWIVSFFKDINLLIYYLFGLLIAFSRNRSRSRF